MSINHVPPARPAAPAPPRSGPRVRLLAVLGGVGLFYNAEIAYHAYQVGGDVRTRVGGLALLFLLVLTLVGGLLMLWESRGDRRRQGPGFLFLAMLRVSGWFVVLQMAFYLIVKALGGGG